MRNKIINLTATGSWQIVPSIPRGTRYLTIQARSSAVVSYRWLGETSYFTVKADSTRQLEGQKIDPGDLEVNASNGVVIEIECNPRSEA